MTARKRPEARQAVWLNRDRLIREIAIRLWVDGEVHEILCCLPGAEKTARDYAETAQAILRGEPHSGVAPAEAEGWRQLATHYVREQERVGWTLSFREAHLRAVAAMQSEQARQDRRSKG